MKNLAHEKGLLLMGPDCGTGVANGIPLAFANRTRRGEIGIVGASGNGIQEVATTIHKLGGGVTNAIGTGGRDLKAAVDGTTLKDGVALLDQDPPVKVIVVISKPPAKEVRDSVMDLLRAAHKPVVVVFMGERLGHHEEGLYQAYTLEETASNQRRWQKNYRCQTLSWRKVKRTSRLTTPGGPWLMKRPRWSTTRWA